MFSDCALAQPCHIGKVQCGKVLSPWSERLKANPSVFPDSTSKTVTQFPGMKHPGLHPHSSIPVHFEIYNCCGNSPALCLLVGHLSALSVSPGWARTYGNDPLKRVMLMRLERGDNVQKGINKELVQSRWWRKSLCIRVFCGCHNKFSQTMA